MAVLPPPPLRERRDEIPYLTETFMERCARREKTPSHVPWNRRRAAAEIGVSYTPLLNKMKVSGISQP